MIDVSINFNTLKNKLFDQTNNLHSLFCAKDILQGEEFLLINADLVADKRIIKGILMPDSSAQSYWKSNIRIVLSLLAVWFFISFGCGILFVDLLDNFRIGGFKLGFWIAQQGAILVFVKTRRSAEKMVKRLKYDDHDCDALHGNLRQNKRDKVKKTSRKQ